MRLGSLGRDLLWVTAGRVVGSLGLLLAYGLLSRALTADEYGEFFLLVSLVSVAVIVGTGGQQHVVLRELGRDDRNRAAVVRGAMTITALGATAIGLVAGGFGSELSAWLDLEALRAFPGLIALWIVCACLVRVLGEAVRGVRELAVASFFNGQAVTGSAATLVFFVVLLIATADRLDLRATIVSLLVAMTISLASLGVVLWRRGAARPAHDSAPGPRTYLRAGVPILCAGLVSFVSTQGDLWVVHSALDTHQVASYGAVRTLAALGLVPLTLVAAALLPRIAPAYYSGRRADLERLTRANSAVAMVLAAAVLLPAVAAPELLLTLVFGPSYAGGGTALRLLAAASLVNVFSGPWGMVLLQTGNQKPFLVVSSAAATLSLGLGYWLATVLGIEGVALAWLVGQGFLAAAGSAMIHARLGITVIPTFSAAEIMRALRSRW